MVQDKRGEYQPLWAAIESMGPKTGCAPHVLYERVKRAEANAGVLEGVRTNEAHRVKNPEREVKEPRQAKETLTLANALFSKAELDRRLKVWRILSSSIATPSGSSRSAMFCMLPCRFICAMLRCRASPTGVVSGLCAIRS